MSLSINNYYYKKYYENYDSTSGNSSAARTSSSYTGLAKGTDTADFSEIAKLFFQLDGTDDPAEDEYTDTYSPSAPGNVPASLYGGDLKALLAQIQSGISYTSGYTGIDTADATPEAAGIPAMLQALGGLPSPQGLGIG